MRIMSPPRSRFAKRRRILTDGPQAVNSTGPNCAARAMRAGAPCSSGARRPGARRAARTASSACSSIRASFADRPARRSRARTSRARRTSCSIGWLATMRRCRPAGCASCPTSARRGRHAAARRARATSQRPDSLATRRDRGVSRTRPRPTPTAARSPTRTRSSCSSPAPGRESHMRPATRTIRGRTTPTIEPPVAGFAAAIVVASRYAHERRGASRSARASASSATSSAICSGLPELYAPGARAHEGIGKWGLMGQGTWVGAATRRRIMRRVVEGHASAGSTSRRSTDTDARRPRCRR